MTAAIQLSLKPSGKGLDSLTRVKVPDLTTSVAGPCAAQLLADLGATVVKVERRPATCSRAPTRRSDLE